jgi:hypothetical protein
MVQHLFFVAIACNYFFAFYTLYKQVLPLFGSTGLEPIAKSLDQIKKERGKIQWLKYPTLFWIDASDRTLQVAAQAGMILAIGAFFPPLQPIAFLLLWALYLSFVTTSENFLSFQWDCLLLEVGLATWLFATFPSLLVVLLLWIILFRLIFSSGFLKLFRGSSEWQNLTALNFHYLTQPLPNKAAFFLHHQPKWFSKISSLFLYVLELGAPFFIFGPLEFRKIAFGSLVLLQLIIFLTGNFAFFNTLTLALCIPLLFPLSLDQILDQDFFWG